MDGGEAGALVAVECAVLGGLCGDRRVSVGEGVGGEGEG